MSEFSVFILFWINNRQVYKYFYFCTSDLSAYRLTKWFLCLSVPSVLLRSKRQWTAGQKRVFPRALPPVLTSWTMLRLRLPITSLRLSRQCSWRFLRASSAWQPPAQPSEQRRQRNLSKSTPLTSPPQRGRSRYGGRNHTQQGNCAFAAAATAELVLANSLHSFLCKMPDCHKFCIQCGKTL